MIEDVLKIAGWVAFADREPPKTAAQDHPGLVTHDRVLVTNNIGARDRMGRLSHAWFASPIRGDDGWVAFDDADRKILGLTHWMDPLGQGTAANRTLADLGYTYGGGVRWRPPAGEKPSWLDGKFQARAGVVYGVWEPNGNGAAMDFNAIGWPEPALLARVVANALNGIPERNQRDGVTPLGEFEEGQWWVKELDRVHEEAMNSKEPGRLDRARAVHVVHNLLKSAKAGSWECDAVRALIELVELKDMKEKAEILMSGPARASKELGALKADYQRRKPRAWEEARRLVAGRPKPEPVPGIDPAQDAEVVRRLVIWSVEAIARLRPEDHEVRDKLLEAAKAAEALLEIRRRAGE